MAPHRVAAMIITTMLDSGEKKGMESCRDQKKTNSPSETATMYEAVFLLNKQLAFFGLRVDSRRSNCL